MKLSTSFCWHNIFNTSFTLLTFTLSPRYGSIFLLGDCKFLLWLLCKCLLLKKLFHHIELEILVHFMQLFLVFANYLKQNSKDFCVGKKLQHQVPFFINTKILLIFFQIFFFITLHVGIIAEETCPLIFELRTFKDTLKAYFW